MTDPTAGRTETGQPTYRLDVTMDDVAKLMALVQIAGIAAGPDMQQWCPGMYARLVRIRIVGDPAPPSAPHREGETG